MMRRYFKYIILIALLSPSIVFPDQSARPKDVNLSNFQFGPFNRWSFSHLREVLPTVNIEHGDEKTLKLKKSKKYTENFDLDYDGQTQSINEIAENRYIDGIIILKNDEILFERYYENLTEDKPHLMNSISKSVVGLLAGKLEQDGLIDFEKPVSYYVPELSKSGWGSDSLRLVLDMKDGSDYSEDYPDFTTTFRIQDCAIGWTDADYCPEKIENGLYNFLPTIGRKESNIGTFKYRSGSTDVIGWVLEKASGKSLAHLISEYIWKPMGAEFDAYITVDESGFVLADHGMNSTLRDLSRIGLLVLNEGKAFDQQIIPAEFIKDMHDHEDPNWPYDVSDGTSPYYRSFWWGKGNEERDLNGYGIHGQLLRVAPKAKMVVAIYSTWPRADGEINNQYWDKSDELIDALIEKFR
jgi:CubicO group peptidase (beta-lactamase class C family)